MTATGYLLTILPKFTSLLSILGASMIISQVLMSKKNRDNMQQRLVCAMSCIDLMVSIVWFTTNLFIPPDAGFVWPLGNKTTCSIQGFIVQSSISSVLYNASLSLYYLVVINFEWKDRQTQKLEKWMHALPLIFGLITASIPLALNIYNPADWDCWIGPTPEGERTKLANALKWAFFYGPLWASIVFASSNMARIYRHVKMRELASSAYRIQGNEQLKQTKAVAWQGSLYVGAFLVTWLFPTIARLIQLCGGTVPPWMVVLAGTFIPFQGFFNAVVYFRLRFIKCKREFSERSKAWVVCRIINLTLCPCFIKNRYNTIDGNDLEHPNESVMENNNEQQNSTNLPSSDFNPCMSNNSSTLTDALEATGFHSRHMPPEPVHASGERDGERPQRRPSRRVSLWRIMKKGGVKATGSTRSSITHETQLQVQQRSSCRDLDNVEKSGHEIMNVTDKCCSDNDEADKGSAQGRIDNENNSVSEKGSVANQQESTSSIPVPRDTAFIQASEKEYSVEDIEGAKNEETIDMNNYYPDERRKSITWSENNPTR